MTQLDCFLEEHCDADHISFTATALFSSPPSSKSITATFNLIPARLRSLATRTFLEDSFLFRILRPLKLTNVIAVGQVCRDIGPIVKKFLRQRMDHAISPWIKDSETFRLIQYHTDSLLIGSFPLYFSALPNTQWKPGTLTIATPRGLSFWKMLRYLQTDEGYEREPGPRRTWPPTSPVLSTLRLKQGESESGSPAYILLIEASSHHPENIITQLPLTSHMLYMTSDRLFILYPKLTLKGIGFVHPAADVRSPAVFNTMRRCARRGFCFYSTTAEYAAPCGDACPTLWRSTQDVAVLCVQFGIADYFDNLPENLRCHSWCLAKDVGLPQTNCSNPFCTRNPPMLPRRDGQFPDVPDSSETQAIIINGMAEWM